MFVFLVLAFSTKFLIALFLFLGSIILHVLLSMILIILIFAALFVVGALGSVMSGIVHR